MKLLGGWNDLSEVSPDHCAKSSCTSVMPSKISPRTDFEYSMAFINHNQTPAAHFARFDFFDGN